MVWALLTTVAVMAVYVWQDGLHGCPDGRRYTSGVQQPYPFHRRFCSWPKWPLIIATMGSLVLLGTMMGDWKRALLLMTLPGAWLVTTRPTTVDAPTMLLAWCSSLALREEPWAAVLLSCFAGFIHERGPVYAALYSWHPLPLVGLIAAGWWRKPAPPDDDELVGRGFLRSLLTHRPHHDWLNVEQTLFAVRGLPFIALYAGTSTAAWCTLGFSWAQRLIATDLGRLVFWAGPVIVRDLPDVPAWMVLAQAVTFKRMG